MRYADRANDAHRAMLDLAQAKGQSLHKYIKRAYRIKDNLGSNFDTILASNFILGMSDVNLRMHAIAFGKLDGQSTFTESVRAVKAMARGCGVKLDRYDESSEDDYDTDSDNSSDYRGNRKHRRSKARKERGKSRKGGEKSEEESEDEKAERERRGIDEAGVAKIVEKLLRAGMAKATEGGREELVREFGQPFLQTPQTVEVYAAARQPRTTQAPGAMMFHSTTYQQPGQPTSGGAGYE